MAPAEGLLIWGSSASFEGARLARSGQRPPIRQRLRNGPVATLIQIKARTGSPMQSVAVASALIAAAPAECRFEADQSSGRPPCQKYAYGHEARARRTPRSALHLVSDGSPFLESVGPLTYSSWLGDLPREASLSLYLHVPFCTELCHYCGCNTKAVRRRAPVEDYARLLETEIDLLAAVVRNRRVVHVHWGGGTPSILGSAAIGRIVERLAATFDLSSLHEHAIELDPRSLTPSLALALARIGDYPRELGRAGFFPDVQQAIGRIQSFDQVARATGALRDAGIEEINFDLMYGLPHQTVDDCATDRRACGVARALAPRAVRLCPRALVQDASAADRGVSALRDAEERIAQMDAATATLEARGFVKIGLDHFAAAGDELLEASEAGNCTATSRAIRPIARMRSSVSAPPRSAACRRAMSRTRRMSVPTRARSPPDISP